MAEEFWKANDKDMTLRARAFKKVLSEMIVAKDESMRPELCRYL